MYGFYGVHKHSVFSGYDFIDKLGRGLIDVLIRSGIWLYPSMDPVGKYLNSIVKMSRE